MHEHFAEMNREWFARAHFYTGSIEDREKGIDFRYRFEQIEDGKALKASTYSKLCYEKATDVEERIFPWTEEGVALLKQWYQSQYENYCASMAFTSSSRLCQEKPLTANDC